ncbi:FAD-binding domain-containing protein [Wolfiporia cocos MD-104 SS10]|uniref:FAD-binding domain-containing protein n=1 Tax=Wolfiporia cocos (strain MD-104) TaxID=742152 RepID=A0A2H3J473_WOLCO|nr:FAD-binding domain-containing protein [Wolfiporia cocos MD-104 SS10]
MRAHTRQLVAPLWLLSLSALALFATLGAADTTIQSRDTSSTCEDIASAISSASAVFWPPEYYFEEDIEHYISSSSQVSTCSVEPGTAEDVGTILQILGSTNTSFAVKGGGHASNPGFSSTPGVQIAMARFSGVTYDASAGTATIGTGLVWDDVYAALEPYGVNVIGGRVTGVGVAGFTLGGGYSFLSNQYGLTVDTVQAFELVLPNGTVTNVTASNVDLFWALKGGFNNYGIVTQFVLQTYPQGQVWGGSIITVGEVDAIKNATSNFYANVTDPKASIITTFNWLLGVTTIEVNIFYDGPSPPDGIFDEFMAIPAIDQDISTRSFLSLVLSAPSNATTGLRGYFNTVSLYAITPSIMDAIVNETEFWSSTLAVDVPSLFISYDVEPFLPGVFSHGNASAWPPTRAQGVLPLNIYYAYSLPASDALVSQAMQESASFLTQFAVEDGQDVANAPRYPNYAIYTTPLERMYGNNVARLAEIKAQYDPGNLMSLCGGWKF